MDFLHPETIVQSGGLLLIGAIVFAESGLLVGFFLPGDTLLFSAGFFASQDKLPLGWLLLIVVVMAIIGDNVGYSIGRKAGPRIFKKKDGMLFRQEYIERAETFYKEHGGKTITIARFVPIVRTFAPVVAGAGKMDRKRFLMFNALGATVWGAGVTLLGYFLGTKIPNIDKYLLPVVMLAMIVTFSSPIIHIIREPKVRKAMKRWFNRAILRQKER
ncbi:MAG TPA: DedA family protein [Candidatus Saccharibacteria bacterium]|jgi:membrane-associated protein|nr:DedA family protein [Candidatus Saccharibacteria bacterium]HMT55679.1 DedA family protein [Candidatus Saccharibacteria bacterium]